MSYKTQAMGSTVHTNHQLGGDGERGSRSVFQAEIYPWSHSTYFTPVISYYISTIARGQSMDFLCLNMD